MAASHTARGRTGVPPEVATVVLNAIEALILAVDPGGRIVLVNPATEDATGKLATELLGSPAARLVHPADATTFSTALDEVRATAIPAYLETRLLTKQGAERMVSWSIRSLVNDAGQMTHSVISGVDITNQHRAEMALAERETELELITATLPIGYFAATFEPAQNQLVIRAGNARFCEIVGVTPSNDQPLRLPKLVVPADAEKAADALAEVAKGTEVEADLRIQRPDGLIRRVKSRVAPIALPGGHVEGCVGWLVDTTEEVKARGDAERNGRIIDESADLVLVLTPAGGVRYANSAARRAAEGPLDHVRDLLDEESAALFFDDVLPALRAQGQWRGEMTVVTGAGDKVPVSQVFLAHGEPGGEPTHVSMIARDISELKALEHHLTELAFHDPLTGLPNRALVLDRLEQALDRATRSQDFVAVMFLDLDYFKSVNDDLGHEAGDELLRMTAGRLKAALRPSDTVSRLGGDEFIAVCEGVHDSREAIMVAERIRTTVAKPFTINGRSVKTSASIGVALAKNNEIEPTEMISQSDTAAYRAKERGRNRYELFWENDEEEQD